jgi:hypothetical protein
MANKWGYESLFMQPLICIKELELHSSWDGWSTLQPSIDCSFGPYEYELVGFALCTLHF